MTKESDPRKFKELNNLKVITARINLNKTSKDELLFTALIEKAEDYSLTKNGIPQVIKKGKAKFSIIKKDEGKIMTLKIIAKRSVSKNANLRVCCYRDNDDDNGRAEIVVTIDNPYRVTTTGEGKYIIVHQKAT